MPASKQISILFIEDSPHDAELALVTLERAGYQIEATVVYDREGVAAALERKIFDLILSDFILPGFSGAEALQQAQQFAPHTPFIFLSGVFGEEHAVDMMRSGAIDYVLKRNLKFLPRAVDRALSEVRERRGRLRAEEALQEVEVRARLAIDAARLGMWDYEPQSGTLIWDARSRAMFGLPPDAPVDFSTFEQRCHPEDQQRLRDDVRRALSEEGSHEYSAEYRILLPDGTLRWIQTRGQSFFEDGLCKRFTGVLMDITPQKLATESLERLNELLDARVQERTRERDRTWELSRDLLAVIRFDGSPVALNPAWESTLGWTVEQLTEASLARLVHPDDLDATQEEREQVRQGQVTHRFVNRMRHADGSYHWLSWTAVPDSGMVYAAARDITSEIAAIDKLAAANRQLVEQIKERERVEATLQQMQRLEAVGQLTAGVAHDFNNLLTVILTSASFLTRDLQLSGAPGKMLQRLDNIRDAGERGAKLTGQLLAFSRRQQLAPKPIDLNDTLVGMLDLLQSTLGGSVSIETNTGRGLWHALVDPTQIELIILNLAINARDAMEVGGTLVVGTQNVVVTDAPVRAEDPEPGEYVMLSVKDNGSGMDAEVVEKAFEPFFTTKEVGKGSGLGLAQVFGFAKQSGGGARIETELGVGTTVMVFLPRVPAPDTDAASHLPNAATAGMDGDQRRVLLVDDDHSVREVTAQMLLDLGYLVIEAESGEKALQALEQNPVDLLLADFAMPGMNGGELVRAVRMRHPGLPVVFVTGYAELEGLGMSDAQIIQKPFRGEELARQLHAALSESVQ